MFIHLLPPVLHLIVAVSSCNAFISSHRVVGKFCSHDMHTFAKKDMPITRHQSSLSSSNAKKDGIPIIRHKSLLLSSNDSESSSSNDCDDGSNIINIVVLSATDDSSCYDGLQSTLESHPFCKMTGVQLNMSGITTDKAWDKDEVALLKQAEIACFTSKSAVKQYLQLLDDHLKVPKDMADEERRKLPNKLDIVGDILGTTQQIATIMAACPTMDIAKTCLNGRWQNNHIYYPKDTQGVVEMKTEELGENDKEEEGDEPEIDVALWADSIVQAAGDVYERSFWGGGW